MERLTPLSAAFLQVEDEDANSSLAIASTGVFEGPAPTREEFAAHIAGRLPLVRRFRQRVRQVPFDLGAPVWVDDPDDDVAWHVRATSLPAPGGAVELHRVVARVMSVRMDRDRPLWEYWLVDGLEGGRWAVIQKVHHCMVDGVSGAELYHLVFDDGPQPRPPAPDDWEPQLEPTSLALAAQAVIDLTLTPVIDLRAVGSLLASPAQLARRALVTARGALAYAASLVPATSTSLVGPIGTRRRYTTATASMSDVRVIRSALGCTVNDVAVAAITGGFRDLLLSRGEEPHAHAVRSLVPVSLRTTGEEAVPDNRVSMMLPYLPVDVADPVQRLAEVRRRILDAVATGQPQAGRDLTSIARHEPFPPVALGVRLAFHLPQRLIVTVTTNVPGPRQPVFVLGRRCEQILPFVPIADRVRIGVAIFSYAGELTFGVTGDHDSAPDVGVLADGIAAAVAELLRATAAVRSVPEPSVTT